MATRVERDEQDVEHDQQLRAVEAYYEAKLAERDAENAALKRWFYQQLRDRVRSSWARGQA